LRHWADGLGPQPPLTSAQQHGSYIALYPFKDNASPEGYIETPNAELDIVQFTSAIYFVEENEGVLTIDVMRMGNMQGTVEVKWETEDGSAMNGHHYEGNSGKLIFDDGQAECSFQVKVMEDGRWSPTMEFRVRLSDPKNCELGLYLHVCRVKIIDNDFFPSIKYRQQIIGDSANSNREELEEGLQHISGLGLLWEFFKLNFHSPGMAWRTVLVLVFDQLQNIYLLYTLWSGIYLVDTLLKEDDPTTGSRRVFPELSRQTEAVILGLGYVMQMFLLQGWEWARIQLDIKNRTRCFLQASLFRKYLNYNEESRTEVLPSDMQIAVTQDTAEVAEGYTALVNMFRHLVKLIVLQCFVLLANPSALKNIVVMPLIMLIYGVWRRNALVNAAAIPGEKLTELVSITQEACHKYRLIADYMQRPHLNDTLVRRLRSFGCQRCLLLPSRWPAISSRNCSVRLALEYTLR